MGFFGEIDRNIAPFADALAQKTQRHAMITANVANLDTPGYKTMDVTFRAALADAGVTMTTTSGRHMVPPTQQGSMDLVEISGGERRDGNNVNIDNEMVKLAQNQLEYRFLARMLARKFSKYKEAITGRAQ